MREIIKRERVRLSDGPAVVPARARARLHTQHESDVEHARVARLLSVEGRVTGVELTCACGRTTVVELQYGPEVTAPETTQ